MGACVESESGCEPSVATGGVLYARRVNTVPMRMWDWIRKERVSCSISVSGTFTILRCFGCDYGGLSREDDCSSQDCKYGGAHHSLYRKLKMAIIVVGLSRSSEREFVTHYSLSAA